MLHDIQMLRDKRSVSGDEVIAVHGIRHRIAKMPVIASACIHIVDIIIDITAVVEPSPLMDVIRGRVVEALIRGLCPADVI